MALSDAGAPAPAVVESGPLPEPAPSAQPPGEPSDPLQTGPAAECGVARPNPNGVALAWMAKRDGSCLVCENAPAPLPRCTASQRGTAITPQSLESNRAKRVSFEGTLAPSHSMCTKRGGPCACNNRCSSTLRLSPSMDATPALTLTSKGEPLACPGDEGSVCCPYALDATTGSAIVIVSGTLTQEPPVEGGSDAQRGYQLEVQTICAK